MPLRGVNSLAALIALLATGCFLQPGRTVLHVPPGEWAAPLGGDARAAYAMESVPETPREQWRRGMERGLQHPPIVHGDLLIAGSTGRTLLAASAENGRRFWVRRFNGPVVGSALRSGDTIFIATASRDGSVYAYSVARGRKLWHTKLRNPASGAPVLAGGHVIASSLRGELFALEPESGDVAWHVRVPGGVIGAPVVHEGSLVLATARDTLLRVSLQDGRVLATRALDGTPSAGLARHGDRALVPVHPGRIVQYTLPDLERVRSDSLGAPVLAAPVVDADGTTFVLTGIADVWRIDAAGATRIAALGGAARESLTLARNGLLVGRLDGTLVLLRRDGSEVWRQAYRSALRAPVAVRDGAAYVSLLNGDVVKLR